MKLNIKDVRILWPFIFNKDQPKNGDRDPQYRATFTLETDHPAVAEFKEVARKALEEKVSPEKARRWVENNFGVDKKSGVLHWGDKRDTPHPDFDGLRFFNAKNDTQPKILTQFGSKQTRDGMVVDADGDQVALDAEDDGKQIYGGCRVNVSLNVVGYDNANGTGVSVYLLGVKFRKDGEEQQIGVAVSDDDLSDDDDLDVAPPKKKKVVA